ncbi:hypothetical protein ACUYMX_005656 [Escherichia coli]
MSDSNSSMHEEEDDD